MIDCYKSPTRPAPPLTKGEKGDFASDGTSQARGLQAREDVWGKPMGCSSITGVRASGVTGGRDDDRSPKGAEQIVLLPVEFGQRRRFVDCIEFILQFELIGGTIFQWGPARF
jgi:hypothetical protein